MRTLLALGLLMLVGCAHARVESWEGNKITACGNKWATIETFEEAAQPQCQGHLTPVSGGIVSTGAYQISTGSVTPVKKQCVTFQCD